MSQDEILASQSTALLTKEKEHHWSTELSQAAAEVQLYKERVSRLEGEVKERNQMVDELRNKLDVAQHRQEINSEEVSGWCDHTLLIKCVDFLSFVVLSWTFVQGGPLGLLAGFASL